MREKLYFCLMVSNIGLNNIGSNIKYKLRNLCAQRVVGFLRKLSLGQTHLNYKIQINVSNSRLRNSMFVFVFIIRDFTLVTHPELKLV